MYNQGSAKHTQTAKTIGMHVAHLLLTIAVGINRLRRLNLPRTGRSEMLDSREECSGRRSGACRR
ncbi:hypothetical protein PM082_004471 [Marasmius tenuissimus]|nr:hypothetical protein PM082_004471 [Marasmius tenuissimus]